MPAQVLKNNCTSGELSPKLHRRSDIQQYQNGLAECLNAIVSPYGGSKRRFGTKYVAPAKYSDKISILRPFEFSVTQSYAIEFGDQYIRFFMDGGQIVVSYTAWKTLTDYYAGDLTFKIGDFAALSQTSRDWTGVAEASNGDVYACVNDGNIYKQIGGTGDFESLNQTVRLWRGITIAPNGNVYACVESGDIYMQTAGTGDFEALSQTSRIWSSIEAAPNGDIYACAWNGDIYKQTAGAGDFEGLSQTNRQWRGLAATSSGDIYACVYSGDIYKQSYGIGDFVALGQTSRTWTGMTAVANGDIYACVSVGDIYKRTVGAGDFEALGQTSRAWYDITTVSGDNVYACVFEGDLYKPSVNYYRCIVEHTSVTFANDLLYGFWEETDGSDDIAYEIPSTYLESELRELRFEQSSDVLYIFHSNHHPAKLTRTAHTSWTLTDCVFEAGPFLADNDTNITLQSSSTVSEFNDFDATHQTYRHWRAMAADVDGDIYACVFNGDIYKQTGGAGAFVALSQTHRPWSGMACTPAGNVYACTYGGDIYMQTDGTGDFVALTAGNRYWTGMCAAPGGDVYACTEKDTVDEYGNPVGGDIYMQTAGTGAFVALEQDGWGVRYFGMASAPNGDIYASTQKWTYYWWFEYGGGEIPVPGDIYKQTAGAGNFIAMNGPDRDWRGMASTLNGDVYAAVWLGDIYKQVGGTVGFVKMDQTSRKWYGMCADSDNNVYACVQYNDIYKKQGSVSGFVALSQTYRAWRGMTSTPSGDIYACVDDDDIYKQTEGTGDFEALGQTSRLWTAMTSALNGDVYACVYDGDIYKQTGGAGNFVALSQTSRIWSGMACTPGGDVYACVEGGYIYKQTGGGGDFEAITAPGIKNWTGITSTPSGDIYACVYSGDIYKQTAGAGDFEALGQQHKTWRGMTSTFNGDVYAATNLEDIYKQTGGAGDFIPLNQTFRVWEGITSSPNGDVYASVDSDDIYFYESPYVIITASSAVFEAGHIGSTWKLTSGKSVSEVTASITSNTSSSAVSTASEVIEIEISGSWEAVITLQRSFNKGTDWYDFMTIPGNCVKQFSDTRDIQYRITVSGYVFGPVGVRISALHADGTGQGTFKILSVSSDGLYCVAEIIDELRATDETIIWAEAAWSGVNGYPRVGKIVEGRLLMACTDYDPRGMWASSSLEYENMLAGTNDDDAFYFSYDAKGGVSIAKWMLSWKHLAIGTYGGEVRLISDNGMTPSNPPDKKQDSDFGSADIPAFVAGKSVIFVDRCTRILREYSYDYNFDSFDSPSLSTLSEHILNNGGGIIDAAYQQKQDSLIWCVLNDGTIGILTYIPAQQVSGWSRIELGGTAAVESVCVIPGNYGHDEVWLTVQRTINSQTVRFIERIEEDDTTWDGSTPVFFVDCGSVYDGTPATTITGLDYMEGETVAVLADNLSVGPKTVSSGQITLDTAASYVIVGLPFTTRIKTLKPDAGAADGTALGRKLRTSNPVLYFVETGNGVKFGPDLDRLKDVPDLVDGELKTIDVPVTMPGGYDTNSQIVIEMSEPLPMFLGSISYDVNAGD